MSPTQHTSFKGDHKVQFYVLYSVLKHVPFLCLFVWFFLLKLLLGALLRIVSCVMTNVIWMSIFFPNASVLIHPKLDCNTTFSCAVLLLFAYDGDL